MFASCQTLAFTRIPSVSTFSEAFAVNGIGQDLNQPSIEVHFVFENLYPANHFQMKEDEHEYHETHDGNNDFHESYISDCTITDGLLVCCSPAAIRQSKQKAISLMYTRSMGLISNGTTI